ncbi:MAG TPA: hypothetical protein VJR04_08790, partial [Terriglobales bacterium]|nr:hypothetical protein [Terriglobales bacterium]
NGEMAALEQKLRAKLKLPGGLIERAIINHRGHRGEGGQARKSLDSSAFSVTSVSSMVKKQ